MECPGLKRSYREKGIFCLHYFVAFLSLSCSYSNRIYIFTLFTYKVTEDFSEMPALSF